MIVLSFDLCVSTCLIAKWLKWCFEVWSSTLLGGMICDMSSGYVAIIAILLLSSVVQFRQTQLTRLYLCHQNGCMVSVYSKFCICMYMHICVLYIYIYIYLCTYIYIYIKWRSIQTKSCHKAKFSSISGLGCHHSLSSLSTFSGVAILGNLPHHKPACAFRVVEELFVSDADPERGVDWSEIVRGYTNIMCVCVCIYIYICIER